MKKKGIRFIYSPRAAVIFSVTMLLACSPTIAQTTLRLSSWAPPLHPVSTEILGKWAEDVERVTEGRVKVETLKSPIGAPAAYYDLVRNGVVDVSFITHDFTPNRFVLTRIAELPFMGSTGESASVALWRTQQKYFETAKEHTGVKLLGMMVHGPGYIYISTEQPPASLDVLKGLKIRATAGILTDVATALGAVPVPAAPPKAYEVMMNGVVDGTLFPAESVGSFKLEPLVKHVLKVPGGFYKSSFAIIMNERKWNALSEEDQQAIWSISGESLSLRAGRVWDDSDQNAEAGIRAAGVKEYTAEGDYLETLRQHLEPLRQTWIKDATQRKVDPHAALEFFTSQLSSQP